MTAGSRPSSYRTIPDARAEVALATGRVEAEHADFAGVGAAMALEDLDERRLARAIGPEQGEHLAAAHGQVHAVERLHRAVGALRAGARGYLTKDAGAEEIRAAVEAVARGDAALDPAVQHHVLAAVTGAEPPAAAAPELPDGLTPREAEVLALIAADLTNAEIADRLVVSAATVKSH